MIMKYTQKHLCIIMLTYQKFSYSAMIIFPMYQNIHISRFESASFQHVYSKHLRINLNMFSTGPLWEKSMSFILDIEKKSQ